MFASIKVANLQIYINVSNLLNVQTDGLFHNLEYVPERCHIWERQKGPVRFLVILHY